MNPLPLPNCSCRVDGSDPIGRSGQAIGHYRAGNGNGGHRRFLRRTVTEVKTYGKNQRSEQGSCNGKSEKEFRQEPPSVLCATLSKSGC